MKPTNLDFTSRVPNLRAWCFFLVEERSKAGHMSHPVQACKPGLGDLSKPTNCTSICFWLKLMYVGVMNLDQIQKIRFLVVNICRSYSIKKVRCCEINFLVIFLPIFGYLDSVKLTCLKLTHFLAIFLIYCHVPMSPYQVSIFVNLRKFHQFCG